VFVTFEGLDGSGKSTQAALLVERLRGKGREVVATREPGGTPVGERVREVLLGGEGELLAWTEAALFAAARSEIVARVIRPALARAADVVCDRYVDSSLAYQGAARGLGVEAVLALNEGATGGLLPDRTFLLLLAPDEAARRLGPRADRIERAGAEFRTRVDAGYRELTARYPDRIVPLDGTLSPEELGEVIDERLRER